MIYYLLCLLLFAIGLYGVLIKRNLIKMIIGLTIMEYALFLFFAMIGYVSDGKPPIFTETFRTGVMVTEEGTRKMLVVDPLPQALVLTAIVIGLATTALIVSIAVRIYGRYGTFDIREIRKLKG